MASLQLFLLLLGVGLGILVLLLLLWLMRLGMLAVVASTLAVVAAVVMYLLKNPGALSYLINWIMGAAGAR